MALRILPFRQYDENDVVNLFALVGEGNTQTTDSGDGDAGVFVQVASGNFGADPVSYATNSYLGKTDYPFVGRNQYPGVPLRCKPATAGNSVLGITLLQTAQQDENGEKLLYNPQKKEELQCVLPGQAVPVLTRGIITLTADAASQGLTHTIGTGVKIGGDAGKVTGCRPDTDTEKIGIVIGTGDRTAQTESDQFAGTGTEKYLVVALGL